MGGECKDLRSQARERYAELGIEKYSDVYEGDIEILYMILNRHLKAWTRELGCSMPSMHLSKLVKVRKYRNGMIKEAYLFVNSHYFTQREAVSFNKNYSIGFAGWASDRNVRPICEAFMEWCEYLAGGKDGD